MLNKVMIVGRIDGEPVVHEKKCYFNVRVPRPYKNEDGIYDTDIVPIIMDHYMTYKCSEYIKKEYLVGISGRIEATDGKIKIQAEKVSTLMGTGK